MVWTERTTLARELWRYGDDDLWQRVLLASKPKMDEIGNRADHHLYQGETRGDGSSMLIAKALSLAAVEVLEGAPRPLRLSRRRPEKEFPGYPKAKLLVSRYFLDRTATKARRIVARQQR